MSELTLSIFELILFKLENYKQINFFVKIILLTNATTTIYKINKLQNSNLESFQNGVDSIVQACTDNGSTPESNTPNGIISAINKIAGSSVEFLTPPVLKNSASFRDSTRTISYTATENDAGYFIAYGYAYTVTYSTDGTMLCEMANACIVKLEVGQTVNITGAYGSAYSYIYKIA